MMNEFHLVAVLSLRREVQYSRPENWNHKPILFSNYLTTGILFFVLFVFCFADLMGPRKGTQQDRWDLSNLHPLYQFPNDLSRDILNNYTYQLGWLQNTKFTISPTTNWENLNEIGSLERLNPTLKIRLWGMVFDLLAMVEGTYFPSRS